MKYFKNIREAHYYYKFPGSYRIGCIIKDDIVIRVYSNNKSKPDFFNKNNREFFYTLKNSKIKLAFENNKKLKKTIHVFSRSNDNKALFLSASASDFNMSNILLSNFAIPFNFMLLLRHLQNSFPLLQHQGYLIYIVELLIHISFYRFVL